MKAFQFLYCFKHRFAQLSKIFVLCFPSPVIQSYAANGMLWLELLSAAASQKYSSGVLFSMAWYFGRWESGLSVTIYFRCWLDIACEAGTNST